MNKSLVAFPSSFILSKRRRCDSNAQGQRMPGGLAGRCTTIYASPPKSSTEGVGVEPTEAFAPTVFGTAWHARAQPPTSGRGARTRTGIGGFGVRLFAFNVRPFVSCTREDSNLQAPLGATTLQAACLADSASDARLFERNFAEKFDEGGEARALTLRVMRTRGAG